MADNNTYVSKTNLDVFTRALKKKLDERYAPIRHVHAIDQLSFTPGIDFLDYRMLPKATTSLPGAVKLGEGEEDAAPGNHTHLLASDVRDGMMSKDDFVKLRDLNPYIHPSDDGFLHVPPTGDVSDGQVLTAGSTPGSFRWKPLPIVDIANAGLMPSELFTSVNEHLADVATKHKTPSDNAILASVGDATQLNTQSTQVVPAINELSESILLNTNKIDQIQQNMAGMAGTLTALNTDEFNRMDPRSYVEGTICYVIDSTDLVVNGKYYDGTPTSFIVVDPDGPGLQEKKWVELSAMTPKMEANAIKYNNVSMANVNTVQEALDKIQENKLSKDRLTAGKIVIVDDDMDILNPIKTSNIDAIVLDHLMGLQENVQDALNNRAEKVHKHMCEDIEDLAAMSDLDIEAAIEAAFE